MCELLTHPVGRARSVKNVFTKMCGARQSSVNSRERKPDWLCGVLLTLKFMISIRKLYWGRCGYYVDI